MSKDRFAAILKRVQDLDTHSRSCDESHSGILSAFCAQARELISTLWKQAEVSSTDMQRLQDLERRASALMEDARLSPANHTVMLKSPRGYSRAD